MKQAELKEMIAKGEGENVEFKRSFGRECEYLQRNAVDQHDLTM